MPWYLWLPMVVCVFAAILTWPIYHRQIREELEAPSDEEKASRRKIRKLFHELMNEGKAFQEDDQKGIDEWISKVECAVIPLMPQDAPRYLQLFGDRSLLAKYKRDRCLIWLKASLIKPYASTKGAEHPRTMPRHKLPSKAGQRGQHHSPRQLPPPA